MPFDLKVEFPRPRKNGRPVPRQGAEHSAVVGLARLIRARRLKTGKGPEGRAPSYASKGKRLVSPRYPESRNPKSVSPSGAHVHEDSKSFHDKADVKRGSYYVSGGMWEGLSLLIRSNTRSRLAFRGRSERQSPNFRKYKSGQVKAKGKKQPNALKGASVFGRHGVNVLEPTDDEVEALSLAISDLLLREVVEKLPISDGEPGRVSRPVRVILAAVDAHARRI